MNGMTILPPVENGAEEAADREAFFAGLPEDIYKTVCGGLDAGALPMALVSADLMVLRQTEACARLLDDGTFYALEGVLEPSVCRQVSNCLREGTRGTLRVKPLGRPYRMDICPAGERQVLLLFRQEQAGSAGVSMASARMREAASRLLLQAGRLADNGMETESGAVRREALRVLREAAHTEQLFGAGIPLGRQTLRARELLERAEQQLSVRGVPVHVHVPRDFELYADGTRLLSALMTLVSNSVQAGGRAVRIVLSAERHEGDCVFAVTDNGPGLSEEALSRLNNWSRSDALPGQWGLGLPYARSIAEEHGGTLLFQAQAEGCRAVLLVPDMPEDWGLETPLDWTGPAAADTVDMELAAVLSAEDYEPL